MLFQRGTGEAGLEIATHWSPMRPKIECWRLDFRAGRQLATQALSVNFSLLQHKQKKFLYLSLNMEKSFGTAGQKTTHLSFSTKIKPKIRFHGLLINNTKCTLILMFTRRHIVSAASLKQWDRGRTSTPFAAKTMNGGRCKSVVGFACFYWRAMKIQRES